MAKAKSKSATVKQVPLSVSGVERQALDMIDEAVASGRYRSRSHFVCEAIKHFKEAAQ